MNTRDDTDSKWQGVQTGVVAGERIGDQPIIAAAAGDATRLKALLDGGAALCHEDEGPLRAAARYGHLEVLKVLVAYGAGPNRPDSRALYDAVSEGHQEAASYLIQQGAHIHVDAELLCLAATARNAGVLQVLLNSNGHRFVKEAMHRLVTAGGGSKDASWLAAQTHSWRERTLTEALRSPTYAGSGKDETVGDIGI